MTVTVSLEQAQGNLKELIEKLAPGDELVITEGDQPIAKLTSKSKKQVEFRKPGFGKGMITIVNDDDSHLNDFAEYIQ